MANVIQSIRAAQRRRRGAPVTALVLFGVQNRFLLRTGRRGGNFWQAAFGFHDS